ncbi:Nucleoside diphosphate kinase 4, chloroplastic [Gracilariopsis chorda]|uniref:Nucleoside diphosphate kinase n=1 Tax=Gracilariopsis chorda TaxID=448386 RepID=A0A2V3IH97_9FLOR|nr:Nucleoside diphosphate kinase 4, chloroplastic [Gracilariopsis chorda]|eukprot:PXF41461.1 Nucleoside diphosphate kinase 4, chloroplastic [Gracilariopsis chorda]
MIKPDGVQRGLVSEIIGRFERRGYRLVAMKLVQPSKQLAEQHYDDLRERSFFPVLTDFLSSSPVVAMVWSGEDIVVQGRAMIGATNPLKSAPGTIRGDLAIVTGKNIIHGSDSVESAEKEIALWFNDDELCTYEKCTETWIYE